MPLIEMVRQHRDRKVRPCRFLRANIIQRSLEHDAIQLFRAIREKPVQNASDPFLPFRRLQIRIIFHVTRHRNGIADCRGLHDQPHDHLAAYSLLDSS